MIDPNPIWYGRHPLGLILAPLSWLYCLVVQLRRLGYRKGWLASRHLSVPVVVVGNLTVGGTGKTPAVLKLAELLRARGWSPGIITRGYGGGGPVAPRRVSPESEPADVGDEPVLLARRSDCPVVAGRDRVAAGALALSRGDVDVLLADDGLQHYRLARDIEIAVVDGARGLGNGRCLPAGPLREPRGRLANVDLVLTNGDGLGNGYRMRLIPGAAVNLRDPAVSKPIADFIGRPVFAVAAIGNPERFFAMLRALGLEVEGLAYPDHYPFAPTDLADWPPGPVLMTEKDAVKCARFAGEDHWFLPVQAELDTAFVEAFFRKLEAPSHV
ncbi:tetraacyldisaccharide 4'-kinase [Thiocapsa rosea]|uniref:Tetraacyldisaccharide 4'-kinase n=1 Tax=Thiocapsa rosea TaxID=69360 RepID=A0A495V0V7_9GAMM|nr:tetraacyldisaccharide 4'-kinase [Thiocapsa rosea]RKT42964.1 lipid-A-disaccharide kinase [Thiocapsa rosea]